MGLKIGLAIAAGGAAGIAVAVLSAWVEGRPPPKIVRAPRSDAELLADARREHEGALLSHEREAVDPAWSASAAAAFTLDLGAMSSETRFQVLGVDCRRSSCIAELRWKSYGDARHDYQVVSRHPYKINCGTSLFVPPPADFSASYEAKVVFAPCRSGSD